MSHKKRNQRMAVPRRVRSTSLSRVRALIFVGIVIAVLGVAASLLAPAFMRGLAPSAPNTIRLEADMGGFSVKEIQAKVGQPLTIELVSLDTQYHTDGGGKHQFAVDELGVSIIAPPKGSARQTFTPTQAGTYTFYCDICCGGKANPTMQGKFIVS
jgi:plastocyanin